MATETVKRDEWISQPQTTQEWRVERMKREALGVLRLAKVNFARDFGLACLAMDMIRACNELLQKSCPTCGKVNAIKAQFQWICPKCHLDIPR